MAFLALAIGCDGTRLVTVEGTIALDGQPLDSAQVAFHSETPGAPHAHASSQSGGSFRAQTVTPDGILRAGIAPGAYKITVSKFGLGGDGVKESVIPAVYTSARTTPLACTVPTQGPLNLNLSSKDAPPLPAKRAGGK